MREWLGRDAAIGLLEYLWTTFLGGRELAEEALASSEDALRFLAIAKLVAEATDVASGSDTIDAWEWVEVQETFVHPFIVGYLLADQGKAADLDIGVSGNLTMLVESHEAEVTRDLAAKLSESDFFIAIWSAHLGVEHFPPGSDDMDEHGFYLDELTVDQGRLLDHVSNMWPLVPRAPAHPGEALF